MAVKMVVFCECRNCGEFVEGPKFYDGDPMPEFTPPASCPD